jgi:hypothetical protein
LLLAIWSSGIPVGGTEARLHKLFFTLSMRLPVPDQIVLFKHLRQGFATDRPYSGNELRIGQSSFPNIFLYQLNRRSCGNKFCKIPIDFGRTKDCGASRRLRIRAMPIDCISPGFGTYGSVQKGHLKFQIESLFRDAAVRERYEPLNLKISEQDDGFLIHHIRKNR